MSNATGERNLEIIQEVLEIFPEKTRKERRKHMMVTDPEMESVGKCIISNRKSQPGVMTVRGCSYAGSKGVVFGPIKDMAHISHGPIGCGQYSRAGRRNYYTGVSGVDSFGTLNFTSDFQERDIVFGGDKKLTKLIEEMEELFPLTKGISIQSECPVGLIGDDIEAVVEMENTPFVKLNLVHCYRSMNYISRHMEEKHGIPWMEYNFFGPTKIAESLRKIADQFDDTIRANAEAVIAKYQAQNDAIIAKYRPRLEGRKVLLYMGGLRPRHVIGAYEDLGMEIVAAGYEFAHNDDYDRTLPDLKEGTLLFDDASSYELEAFVKAIKPDLIGSGIKEKYIFQKMGVPFRQMHSWDYSGPYHGYDGFAIFARDMDMTLNNPAWGELTAPWLKSA